MSIDARHAAHAELSSALASLDDIELRALVLDGDDSASPRGWGASRTIEVDGTPVFAKRVPVTDTERRHPMSTKNRFRLPTYYSYGVGSAGFGAFRELDAHLKTTAWILDGHATGFPILVHHRLMTAPETTADPWVGDDYVRYWNNSKAVANYMAARAEAGAELWLFLEHVPHTLWQWLPENQSRVGDVIAQLCDTVSILGANGIVHFDAHYGNVVTDGDSFFLTDFGLLLDNSFELNKSEREFLARHSHYDYGEAIWAAGAVLREMVGALPDAEQDRMLDRVGLDQSARGHTVLVALLENLEVVQGSGLVLAPEFAETLERFRHVIAYMNEFFTKMRSPKKNASYDDDRLAALLRDAGAIPAP